MFGHLKNHDAFVHEFATLGDASGNITRRGITVQFAWGRFCADRWPVTPELVTTPRELGRCFLPWYVNLANEEVGGDDPGARPLTLAHMLTNLASLDSARQSVIANYKARFLSGAQPTRFSAPIYAPRERSELIAMDRCHRLAALMLTGLPFEVTLCKVEGPADRACLPDLRHHGG